MFQTFLNALILGALNGAVYALLALGLAIIYNISGVLNFAHGHIVVLAMYLGLMLSNSIGIDPYITTIIVVPIMALLGIVLYKVVFQFLENSHVLIPIQATLGIMFFLEGALLLTEGGQYKRARSITDGVLINIGVGSVTAAALIAFIVAITISGILFVLISKTGFGRQIRAVLQNQRGAALSGVKVERVRQSAFALGIALAGVAGILLLPGHSIHPSLGLGYTVIAILAFFIGGTENLFGTLVGGLLLGVVESIGVVYIPSHYGFIAPYVVIIALLLWRPQGLFGANNRRRV